MLSLISGAAQAFVEALPVFTESIDVCLSALTLHHTPDTIKQQAIKEMFRVLKPQGRVVIADFGATKSILLRKILSLENAEYLKGNLNGLILQYLVDAEFRT